ncbi:MAG: WD40/YVTN/BNR-like repeat-containing protein [Acidimicrobiales bacterium]
MTRLQKPLVLTKMMLILAALGLLAAACGSNDAEIVAGQDDLGHIHDLAVDGDGQLLVASHSGLYRIESSDRAVLVGEEQHDLMAMTAQQDGVLFASGHPDLRLEKYQVEGRPPFLGLARSNDGGETWEVLDLLGEADFHALALDGEGLFAAEGSSGRIWHRDGQGEWSQLGEINARDLAIGPGDSRQQIAPDFDGLVWVSADGAVSWSQAESAPALVEIEWTAQDTILGIDALGSIWSADQPQGPWSEIALGPLDVETFYVDSSDTWWVAVKGGAISRSVDEGSTWTEIYQPPTDS